MRRTLFTLALLTAGAAQAATVSVYTTLAAWQTAAASPVRRRTSPATPSART